MVKGPVAQRCVHHYEVARKIALACLGCTLPRAVNSLPPIICLSDFRRGWLGMDCQVCTSGEEPLWDKFSATQ